jgi:DNA-binding NarL/FixJ family response regulator
VVINKKLKLVRVILADDNKEMLDTVAGLLESTSEFDIVGTVADGRALVAAALELKPDIGIIDISMPIMNGIMAAAEIKRLGSEMKIIFLTVNEDCDFVQAAFDIGASGYVVKRKMASDLQIAIHTCLDGGSFVSSGCEIGIDP